MEVVALPDLTTYTVPVERLTRLNDGLEQLEDVWGDELSDVMTDELFDGHESNDIIEIQAEDGQWLSYNAEEDEGDWIEEDEDQDGSDVDEMEVDDDEVTEVNPARISSMNGAGHPSESALRETALDIVATGDADEKTGQEVESSEPPWSRFEVLPNAPADHMFYSVPPSQPSRSFLARLSKEYRALSTSLPGMSSSSPRNSIKVS